MVQPPEMLVVSGAPGAPEPGQGVQPSVALRSSAEGMFTPLQSHRQENSQDPEARMPSWSFEIASRIAAATSVS